MAYGYFLDNFRPGNGDKDKLRAYKFTRNLSLTNALICTRNSPKESIFMNFVSEDKMQF